MPRGVSKYTAKLLAPIVASSHSIAEVLRKLGLAANGGNHRMITARIRGQGIEMRHLTTTLRDRARAVPMCRLRDVVASASSLARVLQALDLPTEGRAHHELALRIREAGLDTSHWTGRGWARGHTTASHPSIARTTRKLRYSDDELFIANAPPMSGKRLVKRLLARGWQYCCAHCGIRDWCGRPLVLHLDHINGINNDNRFDNLRLLCPLCRARHNSHYADDPVMPRRALGSVEDTVLYAA
jgi:hypothetical protein